jgi:DNA-binding response OmpR family regulator
MLKLRKKIAALAGDAPFITTVRGEGYRLDLAP